MCGTCTREQVGKTGTDRPTDRHTQWNRKTVKARKRGEKTDRQIVRLYLFKWEGVKVEIEGKKQGREGKRER